MKHGYRLILDIAGRLVYLAGSCLAIWYFGGGASFGMKPIGVTYLVLWTLWWTVTFLGRQRGESSPYDEPQKWLVIISGIISVPYLIVVPPWEYAHFSRPLPRDGVLVWAGLALFFFGIVLQSVAMWQLRSFYTVRLGVKVEQQLVTTGLYRRIRHPGYLSYILSITGIALAMSSIATLVLVVLVVLFIINRIKFEEKMLLVEFADQYGQYTKRTKKLIPWIY